MDTNIKLSVVIPAYNEAANIKKGLLDPVNRYLLQQKYGYEVLIVDDGSTDNTTELLQKSIQKWPKFKLIKNPHGGKALTVIAGMLQAKGDITVFTDLDQATPVDQIEKFFPRFDEGEDIVIGSRGGRKGAPVIRKMTAWGFSFLRNVILGLPLTDTQCGFKAFNRKAVKAIFPKMMALREKTTVSGAALNAGFDIEMLYLAKKRGLKITEMPVEWRYVGTERFRLVGDAIEAIRDMFRIRLNDLKGVYDKVG